MAKFRKLLLMSSIVLLLFVTPGKAGLVDPTRFKVISKQCYYCMGDNEKGVDNIETCSTENHLEIENCPIQDRFDKCIVFQAFSRSKNTTFFKRECTSERFCTDGTLCSDPDFSSCRFECCTGDLCNNFDFKSDMVSLTTTQPSVVEITTKDAAQTTMISSEETASLKATMTPQTQQKTEQEHSFPKTMKPSAERDRTTTEFEHAAGGPTFGESETSDCVDIDKMCSSYVSNPSHLVYYCEDNKDYMMVYCQRTCKYCNERPHIATTTKQIPTTKKNSEECVDKDPRCRSYVDNAMYLPQFCEDNKSYTSVVCRKTCKFCKGTNTDTNTPKPTTPEVTSTTAKPTSKATSKARPRRTAGPSLNTAKPTLKTTEGNKDSFQGGIPVVKSSPTPDQTFTSKTTSKDEDCKDKRTSCQMYKTMNFCPIHKWYMEQNCPRTCNFCSKDNSNTTTPKPTSSSPELTSNTPEPTESTTPEPTESTTPELTSTSPEPITSTTPELTSTSPEPITSTTPEPTESTTPEPTTSNTPELTSTSPEPTTSNTPEPATSTTPEPTASTTPEPTASNTPEPTTSNTPELTSRIPEPTTSNTPKLTSTTPKLTSATPEPTTSITPEPTTSITPEPTTSTTPELTASTTPDLRSTTPERTSKASTSQPGQNETTYPTSKSTSTPYQESTTKTTSTNEDCMDERPIACAIYAKMSGYCQYTEWFMKKHCPKSCGFCSQENENGNGGQHGITKRTTLNPPPIPTTKSKESTTEEATESTQLPTTKTTRATGTTSPPVNRNSLRWIMMSWGECVNGVQSRVVRCYNFYRGKDYHVTIHACMKLVGEMPAKTRNC